MLIDEIIIVDIKLNEINTLPKNHRKFAMLGKVSGDSLYIDKTNYQTAINSIADASTKNYVQIWFNASGTSLTVYNTPTDFDLSAINIIEKNIILASNDFADQQTMFDKLPATYKDTSGKNYKNIYMSMGKNDDISNFTQTRNIFMFLVEGADFNKYNYIYSYFAPYTQDYFYQPNNFLTSSLTGVSLDTLDFLTNNNVGSLVSFPEFKKNKYFNIGDLSGYNFNLDILKDDITNDIKQNAFNSLSNNNEYTQDTISALEFVAKKTSDFYKSKGLIYNAITQSIPYSNQLPEDIKKGVIKGLGLKYQAITEVKQAHFLLQESI